MQPPTHLGSPHRPAETLPAGEDAAAHVPPASSRSVGVVVLLVAVVLGVAFFLALRAGRAEGRGLEGPTADLATLSVHIIHPVAETSSAEITLPGNAQASQDTPIYARTS